MFHNFLLNNIEFCDMIGSLKYWYQRSKVDFLVSESAVWKDDSVNGALASAAFWVKELPFVKSLSGYWKFFLASNPSNVPTKFHESEFQDSEWSTLPGKCMCFAYI
jgi:beta-galactosidase